MSVGRREPSRYACDDLRTLATVGDGSVDVVVAKSSLDSILCEKERGMPRFLPFSFCAAEKTTTWRFFRSREKIGNVIATLHRVLKKGGVLLVVSHAPDRGALFDAATWDVATHDVASPEPGRTDDPNFHVFACVKL